MSVTLYPFPARTSKQVHTSVKLESGVCRRLQLNSGQQSVRSHAKTALTPTTFKALQTFKPFQMDFSLCLTKDNLCCQHQLSLLFIVYNQVKMFWELLLIYKHDQTKRFQQPNATFMWSYYLTVLGLKKHNKIIKSHSLLGNGDSWKHISIHFKWF